MVANKYAFLQITRRRSEERRVGKECRSRWWPFNKKRKMNAMRQDQDDDWLTVFENFTLVDERLEESYDTSNVLSDYFRYERAWRRQNIMRHVVSRVRI